MKKKLLAVLMTLGTTALLCGFDSTETAESIMEKQQEALSSVSSTDAAITVNGDIAIDLAGVPLSATANGAVNIQILTDEPAMKLEGSIDVLSPLLGQENTYDFKLYMKTNEYGTPDIYTYYSDVVSGDSFWDHESGEGINVNSLINTASTMDMSRLSALGIDFTLEPSPFEAEGKEYYLLNSVIDSTTFTAVLDKLTEISGQDLSADESVALAMELLEGLKINLAYDVDTATFLPAKLHMDLNDSDLSVIEVLVSSYMTAMMNSEEDIAIDITLNDLSMDVATTYNTVTEIVIPDEALYSGYSKDVVPDEKEAQLSTAVNTVTEAVSQ